jgi:hypothetical protein
MCVAQNFHMGLMRAAHAATIAARYELHLNGACRHAESQCHGWTVI